MLNKTSFAELSKLTKRKIVLLGVSKAASKTLRKIETERVAYIVDNSESTHGTIFEGLDVKKPSMDLKNYLVVICSTDIYNISLQLESFGLIGNRDFFISPVLNDLLAISELEELESTIYFTSGTFVTEGNDLGGGLYRIDLKGLDFQLKKIYSGPCYGMLKKEDEHYFLNGDEGVYRVEGDKGIRILELDRQARIHGMSWNEASGNYYITCTNRDSVLEFDENFQPLRKFAMSAKYEYGGQPMHHVNDNCACGHSLYVSMFSSSGNWKNDVFDGCVAEFDLKTGQRVRDVVSNLYMPHNISMYNGSLHVLDSLPGHLRFNNMSVQGTFPAFTRGLDFNKGHYFIGQSKNRNYSRVLGVSNNVSIDCGIVIFNPEMKVSRMIQLPNQIGEIHSIIVV